MKWLLAIGLWVCAVLGVAAEPQVKVTAGSIKHLQKFPSQFVDARNIDIWLPENYSAKKRYSVIYMQDGAALFDASLMFNQQTWAMDVAMRKLRQQAQIDDAIIVGIWNNEKYRHSEYFPQKHLAFVRTEVRDNFIAKALAGKPQSDNYLKFLVNEVKPYVDQHFSTRPDRDHTFVMGSSMGGVISLYAICEYPEVFGGAAALSTHWIGHFENNTEFPLAAFMYLQDHLPDPATHRIYMDHGTLELDALYGAHQAYADELFRLKGFNSQQYLSKVFPGATHNENDWAKRVDIPLQFLLGDR